MDLDKLIKLTRLANNNPNENEANLAARKVCKMLEECNWKLNGSSSTSQTKRGPTTWADVKRSTEPWWKSTYQNYDWEKAYRDAKERERKRKEEDAKYSKEYEAEERKFYKKCKFCGRKDYKTAEERKHYDPTKNESIYVCRDCAFNESKKYEYKHQKHKENYEPPERVLKCKVCGKEVKTRFVGHSSQFTCTNCWYVKT